MVSLLHIIRNSATSYMQHATIIQHANNNIVRHSLSPSLVFSLKSHAPKYKTAWSCHAVVERSGSSEYHIVAYFLLLGRENETKIEKEQQRLSYGDNNMLAIFGKDNIMSGEYYPNLVTVIINKSTMGSLSYLSSKSSKFTIIASPPDINAIDCLFLDCS